MSETESAGYCPHCGKELPGEVKHCPECGGDVTATATADVTRSADRDESPLWPTLTLLGMWILWVLGAPAMLAGRPTLLATLGTLAVFLSIPLLWFDAREGMRAGELGDSRPIFAVILVYILYAVAMPLYVGLRLYRRGSS